MTEEDISQEFRLKNIEKTRNYFIKEINQNELMSKKNKKVCTTLNYIERFLNLVFAVTGCISISAFASLVNIPMGIMGSTIGLNTCATIARIKKYQSIIKKKKNKHDEIVLLAKITVNCREGLVSKSLINSYIGTDNFLLVDGVLRKYDYIKEEIKLIKTFDILIKNVILLFEV